MTTKITINRKNYFDAIQWINSNIGPNPDVRDKRYTDDLNWFSRAYGAKERFYFKNEKDAILFALRWL